MSQLTDPYEYAQGYIVRHLPLLPDLPDSVQVAGRTYQGRPELHCSLINVAKASDRLVERDHLSPEEAEERMAGVSIAAIDKTKPRFESYLNDVRLVDQPERDRHTIVVMARVTGLEEFFAAINRELNLDLPTQPAHVTLFCENGLPIGINAPDGLTSWTRPLDDAARAEFARQVDPQKTFGWSTYK